MEIKFYKRIDLSEFVEYIELKTFSGDIAIQTCICYNASRQKKSEQNSTQNPWSWHSRDFYYFRLVVTIFTV